MQDASFFGYTTRTFIEIIFAKQIANKSTYLSFNSLFFADADLPLFLNLIAWRFKKYTENIVLQQKKGYR